MARAIIKEPIIMAKCIATRPIVVILSNFSLKRILRTLINPTIEKKIVPGNGNNTPSSNKTDSTIGISCKNNPHTAKVKKKAIFCGIIFLNGLKIKALK